MKRALLLITALLLLMIPLASAADWDNIKDYNAEKQQVTITNAFGMGSKIATITLTTPHTFNVMYGKDRKVAEFNLQINKDHVPYNLAFKEMEFYDKRYGGKINREFNYKYRAVVGTKQIPIYTQNCFQNANGTVCNDILDHYETQNIIEWIVLDKATDFSNLPANLTIGIFTDVLPSESVEWIPTFFGIRIEEWAVWNSTFNVGLKAYYDWNSSANIFDGTNNLTANEGSPVYNATNCLIGLCGQTWEGNNFKIASNNVINFTGNYTLNTWIRGIDSGASSNPYFFGSPTNNKQQMGWDTVSDTIVYAGASWTGVGGNLAGSKQGYGNWFMITVTGQDGNVSIYLNATIRRSGTTGTATQEDFYLGNVFNLLFDWHGQFDEMGYWNRSLSPSEITDLFNGGAGLAYIASSDDLPTVTLVAPANNTITATQAQTFQANITDDNNATNATLYINGAVNATIITGNTSWLFSSTQTLPEGNYNWTVLATDSLSQKTWAASNFTITIDRSGPTVTLVQPANRSIQLSITGINLNFTATDSLSSVGTCWYSLDSGANTTIASCANTTFNTVVGDHNVRVYANDSVNNIGSSNLFNFTVVNLTVSEVFPTSALELSNKSFSITINASSNVRIIPRFFFNNTLYNQTQVFNHSSTVYNMSIVMPQDGSLSVSKTFYWSFNLTYNTNNEIQNTTSRTLTLDQMALFICNSTYSIVALNFTVKNESNFVGNNVTTQDSLFLIWPTGNNRGDGNRSFSFNMTGSSPTMDSYAYCLYPNSTSLQIDALFSTSKSGYDTREYWLENYTITNSTKNISIYLLDAPTSTLNILKVQDEYQNGISGALVSVQKLDIAANEYKTLHIVKTDSVGESVLRLQWYDIFYRFIVVKDGVTKLITIPSKIAAEAITLSVTPETSFTHDAFYNLDWTLTFNNATKIFTATYNNLGSSKSVCLRVDKLTLQNFTKICDSCSISSTDTITCDVSSNGDGSYIASLYGKGSSWIFGALSATITTGTKAISYALGTLAAIMIAGTLALFGALFSPAMAIFGALGGLAVTPALGLRSFNVVTIMGILAIALMIIWRTEHSK